MPSPAAQRRAPLLWLLAPLMAGFTAANIWPLPPFGLWPPVLAALGLALGAIGFAWGESRLARLGWGACVCLAASLGGFVLLHLRQPYLHEWKDWPPREVTVSVRVQLTLAGSPSARSISGLGEIVGTGMNDRALAGRRIYFSAIRKISVPPRRSGRYLMRGVVEPLPPETAGTGFNAYLDNLGIRQKLTRARIIREEAPPDLFPRFCRGTADRLENILQRGLQDHPAVGSLYLAMLLGEKAVLSGEQQNAFMRSGTFHIFSISGLHVGVIAGAIYSVFSVLRLPRPPTVALSLLILWLYVQVTGASSPAMRAYLMVAFLLAMQVCRLPGNALAALVTAALVTLLLDPLQLFNTGFQMSYSVVVALVVMGVPLGELWLRWWRPYSLRPRLDWRWYHVAIDWSGRRLIGAGAACWAAFLASIPAGIGYFQLFSPGSLVANLVVIPLSSLAIIGGFLSLLTGLAGLLPLSVLFNSAAAVTIMVMDWFVAHGTGLPGVCFNARFTHGWIAPVSILAMTGIMLVGVSHHWARRYGGFWPPAVLILLLLIFGVIFG